jgi:hypothetical protein
MRFRKVISKRIERDSGGLSLAGRLSAVVAANVNEHGTAKSGMRTTQRIRQSTRTRRQQ